MRSHSSAVTAIGFSHSTWTPARAARIVYSACMRVRQRDVDGVDLLEARVVVAVGVSVVERDIAASHLSPLGRVAADDGRRAASCGAHARRPAAPPPGRCGRARPPHTAPAHERASTSPFGAGGVHRRRDWGLALQGAHRGVDPRTCRSSSWWRFAYMKQYLLSIYQPDGPVPPRGSSSRSCATSRR